MPETSKAVGGKGKTPVHIDADEVSVVSTMEVPEGHVVVEPPTAATPAITVPETAARAAEVAAETGAALKAAGRLEETIKRTGSQRRINLLWELTQAIVTIMVVFKTLDVAGKLAVGSSSDRTVAFLLMSNAFFMIVTFYYQRTNHTRTGGVGGRDVDTDR